MSISKTALEEVNARLQWALYESRAREKALLGENTRLSDLLAEANGLLEQLEGRYLRLGDYVRALRAALEHGK